MRKFLDILDYRRYIIDVQGSKGRARDETSVCLSDTGLDFLYFPR
jgi:hypothetical protein